MFVFPSFLSLVACYIAYYYASGVLQISFVDSLVNLCTREAHATVFVLFNFISPVQTHWGKYFFWNALENNSIESIKYKREGISIKLHWNGSWKRNCTDSYFIARNPKAVTRYIVELRRFYSKWYQECVRRLEGVGQPLHVCSWGGSASPLGETWILICSLISLLSSILKSWRGGCVCYIVCLVKSIFENGAYYNESDLFHSFPCLLLLQHLVMKK